MSQLIDLELTQQSRYGFLSLSWVGLWMLVASLILAIFVWQAEQAQQAKYAALSPIVNQQQAPKMAIVEATPTNIAASISPIEIKQIGMIVNMLVTPWNAIMLAIEQADMPDIALLNVEPDIKKQQVMLAGEAKNLPIILRYIEQLEAQPLLHEVYLQKHQVEETDISKPVSFSILAKWKVAP